MPPLLRTTPLSLCRLPVLTMVALPVSASTAYVPLPLRTMLPALSSVPPLASRIWLPRLTPLSTLSVAFWPALLSTVALPLPSAPLLAASSVPPAMAVLPA